MRIAKSSGSGSRRSRRWKVRVRLRHARVGALAAAPSLPPRAPRRLGAAPAHVCARGGVQAEPGARLRCGRGAVRQPLADLGRARDRRSWCPPQWTQRWSGWRSWSYRTLPTTCVCCGGVSEEGGVRAHTPRPPPAADHIRFVPRLPPGSVPAVAAAAAARAVTGARADGAGGDGEGEGERGAGQRVQRGHSAERPAAAGSWRVVE